MVDELVNYQYRIAYNHEDNLFQSPYRSPSGQQLLPVCPVKAGDATLLFLAGQVAVDPEGNIVGQGDIARQTERVFENIKAILEANGASLSHIVKANFYITDMSLRPMVTEVRERYITTSPPASTFLEVKGLAHEDWMIEIEVIAVVHSE